MSIAENAGRVERALEAAKQAVADDDASAAKWHDLGVLYQLHGDLGRAREALETAAGLDPTLASVHNNLGNVYVRLNEHEKAVASYRRALGQQPTLVPAHVNAASVLHILGRNQEALAHARRAIELDPAARPVRITAAFITSALEGHAAALALIDELLAEYPDDADAIAARAYVLLQLDRFADALAAADAGLRLRPGAGLLVETRACALRGLGRIDEALRAFDEAYLIGRDRSSLLVLKAGALLEAGRLDEARSALEAALEMVPDLASAWLALTELRTFAADDPDLARMKGYLETSPLLRRADMRTMMHFALGKAYHKANEPRAAFGHFAAGNALKRAAIAYDVAADERFAFETIALFTPERMQQLRGSGDASRAPIFVLGMPRSGTSLVEQILASHPDVHGAGELLLFDRAIAEAGTSDLAALGTRYLELVDEVAPRGKRVVDKLPSNFRHAGLIHAALPRARIVHCERDALDTCFSCYTTLFTGRQDFSWDLRECGRFYRAYAALMRHWRAVLPADVLLDVRYEDVVADLETSARRLLAFCGLPWTDAVLRFYETKRPIRTASYRQARRPIYTTSVRAADAYRPELHALADALEGI